MSEDTRNRLSEPDAKAGLTAREAADRLARFGPNTLKGKRPKTWIERFLSQFKDAMIVILLVAAAISFVVAARSGDPFEFFEPALILLIVVLNALMGAVQESRAEKSLEALKSMSTPHARVRRDGREALIASSEVVPGDVVLVEAGDFVPADARLIESANLKAEESALTGESVPVEKDARADVPDGAPLGDRRNMIFSGCGVTYGRGVAVVTETGMDTQMGRIAAMLAGEADAQTPLQARLAGLGRVLGIACVGICAVIFVIGLLSGMPLIEIFMVAVSLAVSAIPEGLPAIVTIVLSIGVTRMVKRNAIIRRLPAVETLGGASVICSDKTGTLTQNRMTLAEAYSAVSGAREAVTDKNTDSIRDILRLGTLCCDGSIEVADGREKSLGDPTETSIVAAALHNGMTKAELNERYPRVAEVPFDSDRKLMSVVCRVDGRLTVIAKGGVDTLLACCSGGGSDAREIAEQMSGRALRVLGVATRVLEELPDEISPETIERDLTFVGLVGMIDPPRDEVRDAVAVCRQAGIRPVMITGDHVLTASAIARSLGIQREGDEAVTGAALDQMTEPELDARVEGISVYARVSPENKIRIVKAWQKKDQVVAMTGDGVNDAPALKAADIGCAMGITGTDVAKSASDMTLTDDNFATIVEAVREGRGIYANIRRVVAFLLGTNIGEILTTFLAMVLWGQAPFLSMQLLWINLVTDSLPAVALGMEAVDPDVMRQPPKPKNEGLFAHGLGVQIALQGAMFAALTLIAFRVGQFSGGSVEAGRTMAFIVMGFCQVFHAFNMRSDRSLFHTGFFTNRYESLAALASSLLMCLVLFVPPVRAVFELTALPAKLYLAALGMSFVPLPVLEIAKRIIARVRRSGRD